MTDQTIEAPGPVGLLGLGAMGSGMAQTLARGGFRVKAYDLSPERRQEFETATGQSAASSVEDALTGVAAIVTMLPDGKAVRAALLGTGGAEPLASANTDLLVIDCSSCAPSDTQALSGELAARGIAMVDAPVSGGVPGTRAGTLTMMAGGTADAVKRADAILHTLGKTVYHTGPSGSGHAMKTLVNFIGTSQMLLDFQALLVGQKYGLAPETMVEILNRSYAKNLSTEIVLSQQILSGAFAHNFSLALAAKDARIAAETAEAAGFGDDTPRHFSRLLDKAVDALGGDADLTRVYQYLDGLWGRPS